jgi:hypothetical protein
MYHVLEKNCRRDQFTHDSLLPSSNTIVFIRHSRSDLGEEPTLYTAEAGSDNEPQGDVTGKLIS